jgi:Flp pilus assembly pilin Flp
MSKKPTSWRHGRQFLTEERGSALIEFALVLPLLLLVIFGVVDFGKALAYKNDDVHLANQAARYAVVNSCAPCSAGQKLNAAIQAQAEHSSATVAICYPTPSTGAVGEAVHVTVKDTFKWFHVNFPLIGNWAHIDTISYSNSEMRIETATTAADRNYTLGTWDATKKKCD